MIQLPFAVERSIVIRAPRATVFRYFTDSARFAAWWGAGSTIDPRPGGRVYVRYPNAVEASGELVEIDPPSRVVFTFGYLGEGKPIPPGGSRVAISLAEHPEGTLLALRHEVPTAAVRDEHVQGWRYQLAVFATVVADEIHADADARADAWFAAWSEPDAAKRRARIDRAATPDVRFSDRFSCVAGAADLEAHLGAFHVFMPGMKVERAGAVRHCQGTALADWIARGPDGAERGRGTNVFRFAPDGRIADVTGLWNPPASA